MKARETSGNAGTTARRIRYGGRCGGIALGPEQQLHHLKRRAFLHSVMERQPPVLRNAVPGGFSAGGSGRGRGDANIGSKQVAAAAKRAWAQLRALSASLTALGLAPSSSTITPNGAPLAAA